MKTGNTRQQQSYSQIPETLENIKKSNNWLKKNFLFFEQIQQNFQQKNTKKASKDCYLVERLVGGTLDHSRVPARCFKIKNKTNKTNETNPKLRKKNKKVLVPTNIRIPEYKLKFTHTRIHARNLKNTKEQPWFWEFFFARTKNISEKLQFLTDFSSNNTTFQLKDTKGHPGTVVWLKVMRCYNLTTEELLPDAVYLLYSSVSQDYFPRNANTGSFVTFDVRPTIWPDFNFLSVNFVYFLMLGKLHLWYSH